MQAPRTAALEGGAPRRAAVEDIQPLKPKHSNALSCGPILRQRHAAPTFINTHDARIRPAGAASTPGQRPPTGSGGPPLAVGAPPCECFRILAAGGGHLQPGPSRAQGLQRRCAEQRGRLHARRGVPALYKQPAATTNLRSLFVHINTLYLILIIRSDSK